MTLLECECSCITCKNMCFYSTCIPTPEEARKLVAAGYAGRLTTYCFESSVVAPAPAGMEQVRNLPHTRFGQCTFRTKEGLCELHAAGLKPLEGRLARHDRHWLPIRVHVAKMWSRRDFRSIKRLIDAEKENEDE